MPLGEYKDFDSCVTAQVGKGQSQESAKKICGSIQDKAEGHKENEILLTKFGVVEFKEENGEFYSSGFVATTHPDRAKVGERAGDILTKNAVRSIVDQINNRKDMMADLASYRHDWVKENNPDLPPVGRAIKAEVRELPNGHYGAWVETHHNKQNPKFDNVKYEVEKGYLPGYSIEYETQKSKNVALNEGTFRMIDELDLKGYGLANGRLVANPQAKITSYGYKEIMEAKEINSNEVKLMAEIKEGAELPPVKKEVKENVVEISVKEHEQYKAFLEMQVKEKQAADIQSLVANTIANELKKIQIKNRVPFTSELKEYQSTVEFKEWSEINSDTVSLVNQKISVKEAFNRATQFAVKTGAFKRAYQNFYSPGGAVFGTKDIKMARASGVYGEKIELKAALQSDTNETTDTDYLQSAAELSDIYAPAVTKMLNQKTTYFGLLPKVDFSGHANISWRAENVANTSATSAAEGASIARSYTGRQKLEEVFKYYYVGIEVTGQMIESARSGIGDIFQAEVEASTRRLLALMNTDLFGTNGQRSETAFLGLEYLSTSSTYTTLYGLTRSATNLLGASNSEFSAQSSAAISKPTLRTAIRTLEINGADRNDLVMVCHPLQRDMILALLDDAQRFMSTAPRAGFEGMPTFDGVPIHADKDANNDDIFVCNLGANGLRLGIQVPVRFEDLAKTSDSRSGFLKFYGNQYAEAPKQAVYMIQGLATS